MPRILHVLTVPDSLLFLRGQVSYVRAHGYDVAIACSPGKKLDDFAAAEGARAWPVEMPRRITPLRDLLAVARLVAVLRREQPDIVHAHTPKGGLLGMIAATVAGVPVRIYHMRGLPMMTATGRQRTLLRLTERVSCRLATRVLCVSPSLREVAVRERLCPADHIQVLLAGSGNGVDSTGKFAPGRQAGARAEVREELGIPAEALVFGFVGRLVQDKGVRELGAAWAELRRAHQDAHLLVVGDFEPRDPVPDEVRAQLAGEPSVHLAGFRDDTPRMYAAMDVVVLPTYREGFPNVPLEAASMGLPVIATRIPGCVDAVADGATGTLVEARDAGALEAAMAQYADDPSLRARHGSAGRARVRASFDRERLWEALVAVYDASLAEVRP